MTYKAIFFDGVSSSPRSVSFSFSDRELQINLPDQTISYSRNKFEIAKSFANVGFHINFTDGARLEVRDESFGAYIRANESLFNRVLDQLKHKPAFILIALMLSIVATFFFLTDGLQAVARVATTVFPVKTEKLIGKYISNSDYFEKSLFQPSLLSLSRQQQIQRDFSRYCEKMEDCPEFQIKFRQSRMAGANAFALPGGDIIVTDALVTLAQGDDEINAVLAHELGHIAMRHSLRQMIQTSLRTIVLVGITGDVDSIASALPGLMFDLKYSREIEADADNYAIAFMDKNCISRLAFIQMMEKMVKEKEKTNDPTLLVKAKSIFSTHPSYDERIMKFQSRSTHCN